MFAYGTTYPFYVILIYKCALLLHRYVATTTRVSFSTANTCMHIFIHAGINYPGHISLQNPNKNVNKRNYFITPLFPF